MNPRPYLKTGRDCHRCGLPIVTANSAADHPFSEEDEQLSFCPGCSLLSMQARFYPKEPSS